MDNIRTVRLGQADGKEFVEAILSRSEEKLEHIQQTVDTIINGVKEQKDAAVFAYSKQFDHVDLNEDSIKVQPKEVEDAFRKVDKQLLKTIERSAERIADFHRKQLQNSWLEPAPGGETMGQLIRPLSRVGVYVPGGKAAYPSTVLMNVIPAKVAGVGDIVMTTPCKDGEEIPPVTLAAAKIAGVTEIYRVGGAQAVAALALGTPCIPKVDKIVGPGNIFVATAKKSVYGLVDIDSVAGPSEILILADDTAVPAYVAADLLSQAEHDEMASAVLVTCSEALAAAVALEVEKQTGAAPRADIIRQSLANYSGIIIADTQEEAVKFSNEFAPEHLEICMAEPFGVLNDIQNAGAIFLGNYTPEPLGDYMAGPNHVLPTGGTAKFFSPLTVDDFVKKSSVLSFSKNALAKLSEDAIRFAESEGLFAHAQAVRIRQ